MNKSVILFFLSLIFFVNHVKAQLTDEFHQLIGGDGQTQSITYAIDSDSIGNIWVATEEGVLKYNSKQIKSYNIYRGLPEFVGTRVKKVFVDSKQRVWIGTERGVCIYNDDLDQFDFVNSEGDLTPSLVESIVEDLNGDIWIGGFNGLWKTIFDSKTVRLIRKIGDYKIQAMNTLKDQVIFGTQNGIYSYNTEQGNLIEIAVDNKTQNIASISKIENLLLVGTKSGNLYQFQPSTNRCKKIELEFKLTSSINEIIEYNQVYLMATDGSGLLKLDRDFNKIEHYIEDPNNYMSLSSNGIYDVELSKEGFLWIATYGGGVNYLKPAELTYFNLVHEINTKNSIVSNFTRAIEKDNNGKIWFGTKQGLSIWDRKSNQWIHLKRFLQTNITSDPIVLSLESEENNMWVGTYNQGLFKIDINSLKIEHINKSFNDNLIEKVYAIYLDSDNNMWAGGIHKDLAVISQSKDYKTYPIQQVRFITEGNKNEILVCGRDGLYVINHKNGTFRLIQGLQPEENELSYSTINSVRQISDNKYILATNGEGLVFYDSEREDLNKIKKSDDMPSDIVLGLIALSDNNIWASTANGLVNILIKDNDTILNVFDKEDGLASSEFNYGSFAKLNDSLIGFGGVNGVSIFNPYSFKPKYSVPNLVFESFKLSNKTITPGQKPLKKHINKTKLITLNHFENSIEFEFTGVLHNSASKVEYTWMLEGFDEDWSKLSKNNLATYTNLNPGNYTFKVRASNKHGLLSEERSVKLKIRSPWWATNIAYLFYLLGLIALIYTVTKLTTFLVRKRNADNQIEFFNNITHEIKTPLTILISSLDEIKETEDSSETSKTRIQGTIKRINSLFEQMLNFQKVTTEDLNEDISKIDVYAHINQRIKNFKPLLEEKQINIQIHNQWKEDFYFDKDSFDKILLNLVSNAIKYSKDNGTIIIETLKLENDNFQLTIADEGIGIPDDQQKFILKKYFRARNVINSQSPGTGLGLMMVKRIIEKSNGSITFKSEENKGTKFTITLKNFKDKFYSKEVTENEEELPWSGEDLDYQSEVSELSDSKILIVEDNDELRSMLSNTLGTYFQVYEASNGKEGLETAANVFPDIIITDLIMPEMDGMQMAKKLKDDINLNHIPVFMLTVLQNSDIKLESIESGISEYFEKPVDKKYLLAKITNTLKWQKQLREKYIHDSDKDTANEFRSENDKEFLNNLEKTILDSIENYSFSVHDLSRSFGMSRTSLYMKLKNLVDLSPQDFVIHTKLKHAKKLLITGKYSVKEVAYQSGFSNPKYFSTAFKKFYGKTPSGFVESLKNN